jgi:hypothetical protein
MRVLGVGGESVISACVHCGDETGGRCCAFAAAADEERSAVLVFLRAEAERARLLASDYRIKNATDVAKNFNRLAEKLGNVANRIERGEHLK